MSKLYEPLSHPVEVLLRDAAILVEVDPCEIGVHLLHPVGRHDCRVEFWRGRGEQKSDMKM